MRFLVTGAAGGLGSEVVAELERRSRAGHTVVGLARDRLDVADRDAVLATVVAVSPDVIIHPAAFTAVDACESDPARAFLVNAYGTRNLAEAARLVGAHLAYVSTDYVFDGTSPRPYHEWDEPHPMSVYGASKLAGERELDPSATIVRTSWVCGVVGANMVKTVLRLASGAGPLRFVDDQRGSPSIITDIAPVLVDLALQRRRGIFHLTNAGETTWFEFARAVVEFAGGDPSRVEPIATADLDPPRAATRPANSVLDNAVLRAAGWARLPHWRDATADLVATLLAAQATAN
jgi:dTDP-4-dehydrorhamnose reductase